MGLFSRKKKSDDQGEERAVSMPQADAASDASSERPETPGNTGAPDTGADGSGMTTSAESTPTANVNISFSSYRGVGASPARDTRPIDNATPGAISDENAPERAPAEPPAQTASASAPQPQASAAEQQNPARPALPKAPAAPPLQQETVSGVKDNALVRDALAALPEKPGTAEALGVLRQLMQGHLFLRVKGDARAQLADGKPLAFELATIQEGRYMLAYSSGRGLQDAVKADGDTETSAIAQPVQALLAQLIKQDFAGLIIDNQSAPRRVVLRRAVLEQALGQGDDEFRLKSLLARPRTTESPRKIAELIAQSTPLWVAVGKAEGDEKVGVAEARLADGTRLVQVHSHPLEIAALGRDEKALPLAADKLGKLLRDNPQMGGVIIDPAGPLITLTREELEPVIALAGPAEADGESA